MFNHVKDIYETPKGLIFLYSVKGPVFAVVSKKYFPERDETCLSISSE